MGKLFELYCEVCACLPTLERTGLRAGIAGFVIGAVQTEVTSPILGGINVVLGATLVVGSVSTAEAIEALDNRGKDLL